MNLRRTMTTMAAAGSGLALSAPAEAQYVIPPGPVAVYPTPGTFAASTRTQISFRGRALGQIGTIDVTGTRSGHHAGRLLAHSDGAGASFVPNHRFTQGELVTVKTALPIPNSSAGSFRFRIARASGRIVIPNRVLEPIPAGKRAGFQSRQDLHPPLVTVSSNAGATAPGYVILSPKAKLDKGQAGPMVVDNRGQLVWFRPLPRPIAATDVRVQRYQRRPVLTWWQGTSRQGIGTGEFVIVDEAYNVVKKVQTPDGFRGDLHEFLITPRDTALVIAYPAVRANLKRFGGAAGGRAIDSVIQEIDIPTGLMLFEWHSLGAVSLADSFSKPVPSPRVPWDYFHANSVSLDSDDDILVSARNTWAVYKIDRLTGRLEWTLGGKRSTFKLPADAKFAWQHDARRRADGALTVFDNSAFPPVRKFSRALALRLDEAAKTVTLERALAHPRKLLTATQGNQQSLPGGGTFVGWGSQRYFTEYGAAGAVVWDAHLSVGYETYRAYRSPWVGRPLTKPRAAGSRSTSGSVDVFASWNGSTETAAWDILAGPSEAQLKLVTSVARDGFETRARISSTSPFVAVRAKDAAGAVLATSPAARLTG